MKILKNTVAIIMVMGLSFYMGCKEKDTVNDPLTAQLKTLENGGAKWMVSSVTKDGHDVMSEFTGFKLSIDEYTYATEQRVESAWPASGTWSFQNDDPNLILRDGDTVITVEVTDSGLTLRFAVSGLSGGRTEGLDGDYVFVLISE